MMHCQSANPIIRKAISDYMIKEIYHDMETCYDTDNVVYKVSGVEAAKEIRFAFRSLCSKKILEHGGQDMLKQIYGQYLIDGAQDPDFDVELKIDASKLPKTQKLKKSMDDETQDRIRDENDKTRAERKALVEPIAELIANFKMHFMSAPIRRAMNAALADKQIDPVEIPYREHEKFWVLMPAKNEVQVYFAVHFTQDTDVALARVMLLEWQDSQRKVKAPPNIKYHDKEVP